MGSKGNQVDKVVRTISNSEVESFSDCQLKHYFRHRLNLVQRKLPTALATGIFGHEILAHFYTMKSEGREQSQINSECMDLIDEISLREDLDPEVEDGIRTAIFPFFKMKNLPHENWEILDIEKNYEVRNLPGADSHFFGFTLDLLVKEKDTGEVALVDHKFVYDFWTMNKIAVANQPRKYKWALNQLGIPVTKFYIQQLRTRKLKSPTIDDRYRLTAVETSSAEDENFMWEHIKTANEIAEFWNLPQQIHREKLRRAFNYSSCKSCELVNVCTTQMRGESAKKLLLVDFQQNVRYGEKYNNEPDAPEKEVIELPH
jgi:hypothetical protein